MFFVCISALLLSFASCGDHDEDKALRDPASAISGTYVGHGQLEMVGLSGLPLEEYQGMKIMITKSSNEFVILTPYLADGTPFFSGNGGSVYQITQSANGDFMLSSTDRPSSRITISKSGNLSFYYPYVSVNGESGYALNFTGQKQK